MTIKANLNVSKVKGDITGWMKTAVNISINILSPSFDRSWTEIPRIMEEITFKMEGILIFW